MPDGTMKKLMDVSFGIHWIKQKSLDEGLKKQFLFWDM